MSLASYYCSTPLPAVYAPRRTTASVVLSMAFSTTLWYDGRMAKVALREQAQELRSRGNSISEIAEALKASKSTVSYWCRDIKLSSVQLRALAKRQESGGALGRLRAAEKKRLTRIAAVAEAEQKGKRDVGRLSERDIFILGTALYWGEGYKSGNEECGLTNSNPDIIRSFITWMRRIYNVRSPDLILRVSINNSHRGRVKEVEKYWSKVTGIPLTQFTTTSLIKSSAHKIYSDPQKHFGTLRVKIRRGTQLRRRIIGSLDEIASQMISIYSNSLNAHE